MLLRPGLERALHAARPRRAQLSDCRAPALCRERSCHRLPRPFMGTHPRRSAAGPAGAPEQLRPTERRGPEHEHLCPFWRRTDVEGLERLELAIEPGGVTATSTVICLEAGGFRLDHRWRLDPHWRAQAVTVERWNAQGHGVLRLERAGTGWRVDGAPRPDLEGAEEPDLSVTPFCNTFPIRRTPEGAGASLRARYRLHRRARADGRAVEPALRPAGARAAALRRPRPVPRLRGGPDGGRRRTGAALRTPVRAGGAARLTARRCQSRAARSASPHHRVDQPRGQKRGGPARRRAPAA